MKGMPELGTGTVELTTRESLIGQVNLMLSKYTRKYLDSNAILSQAQRKSPKCLCVVGYFSCNAH